MQTDHIHEEPIIQPEELNSFHPRNVPPEQIRKFEQYAAEIFTALGMDVTRSATRDTPRRFIQAMFDVTQGYEGDPKLLTVFPTECRGGPDCRLSQLIEGPIRFFSLCEHHALPIIGRAWIAYIPHEHLIGVSKLIRLVHLYAKRFTVQERIGQQIADALTSMLQPHGVGVYIDAQHLCTQMRGVRELPPTTRCTYWRGNYETDADLRREFLMACGMPGYGL